MPQPTPIIPPSLKQGSTIAFISPSARLNDVFPIPLSRATAFFENRGYIIKTIFNSFTTTSFRSETLKRAQEIHDAFLDPQVTAIISTIGGTSCNELLPHLNYDIIKKNPNIFVGYSDNTLLHYAFLTQTVSDISLSSFSRNNFICFKNISGSSTKRLEI